MQAGYLEVTHQSLVIYMENLEEYAVLSSTITVPCHKIYITCLKYLTQIMQFNADLTL